MNRDTSVYFGLCSMPEQLDQLILGDENAYLHMM